jgi:hypothetical protein
VTCNRLAREQYIKEKDIAVAQGEKLGMEYIRTPGEYGHMLKDYLKGLSFYLCALLRKDSALASQVSKCLGCVGLACTWQLTLGTSVSRTDACTSVGCCYK